MTSDKMLLFIYRAPKVYGWFRIVFTLILFVHNFLKLPLLPLQAIAIIGYLIALFNYSFFKNDVPIMSIFLPNILYYAVVVVVTKNILIVEFLPLLIIDITFVLLLWVKAIKWPFYI